MEGFEQSYKMALFMAGTKSACATIKIRAETVRANKYILIEAFMCLIWNIIFKTVGYILRYGYVLCLVLGCKWATPNGIFLEAVLPRAHALKHQNSSCTVLSDVWSDRQVQDATAVFSVQGSISVLETCSCV